jgi:hypothetical protein
VGSRREEDVHRILSDGMEYADGALAIDRNDARAHVVRAALLVAQKRLDEARTEAERAFAINPLLRREWSEVLREALPK